MTGANLGRSRSPNYADRRFLMRLRIVARKYGSGVAKFLFELRKFEKVKAFAEREGITLDEAINLTNGKLN